ncbi:porin [Vibrio metschnikovii]|uniref:porin n=1 Tax=Vibrio metschnikovii TaxID=28172 RepID=UPI001C30025C|nr:porin [Vibrio metschnikovii]
MNKTLIALAVSAAAMTAGVNAGEIYNQDGTSLALGGRAEARLSLQDGKAEDASRVRINVLGKTQINDSLYGLGFYEGQLETNDKDGENNNLENRYAFAGIGGDFGLVTYGKNDGALGVITDFTDIMAYHGNKAAYKLAVADRADNMLTYAGQFDDLAVKASYRFADRVEDTNTDKFADNNQDGYSLSAIYTFADTGFAVGAGYADQDKADQWMLAASYAINDLYFAGTYVDGQDKSGVNKKDKTGYELAAKYTMQQTVFTTSYNYLESKTSGQKTDEADSIAIDATYFFKPNFRSYISYNFNLLDSDKVGKVNAEDELALGLRYDF